MVTSYTVLIPLCTAEQIDGALLRVWTVKPLAGYLRNIILSHDHLHIADLSIWRTPKGVYIKNLVVAVTGTDTTAASQTTIDDLKNWILEIRTHDMTAPLGNRKVRNTTKMIVNQRANMFTYSTTMTNFGFDPTTTTIQSTSLEGIF